MVDRLLNYHGYHVQKLLFACCHIVCFVFPIPSQSCYLPSAVVVYLLFVCLFTHLLSIFGHEGAQAGDIIFVNWLNMVRAGLVGLEYYTPQTQRWRQAHMQARHVILRVLLDQCPGLVAVERTTGADGRPDAVVRLDRSRIETDGKKTIGDFLQKLQVNKQPHLQPQN